MSVAALALRFVLILLVFSAPSFAAEVPPAPVEPRKMMLTIQPGPNEENGTPKVGFVLSEPADYVLSNDNTLLAYGSPTITDKFSAPGPPLVLRRDEPIQIELLNLLTEAMAVRWPDMELERYDDAVHGFVRQAGQTMPLISPGESMIVRFTPRRSGTFVYETRTTDGRQLTGLHGAVVVIGPGDPPFDAARAGSH